MQETELLKLAAELRDLLESSNRRLVLAESCTAGRVAATLSCLAGISQWLCGSFVVYRSNSKAQWLDIPTSILIDPEIGPVSPLASQMLAEAILQRTPESAIAVAVTGDVGPGAPPKTDGRVFIAIRLRDGRSQEFEIALTSPPPQSSSDQSRRIARLQEATAAVLASTIDFLANNAED
ncbi:CinA family protein [Aureliella helgolandensis]|nr:CinA family protein [Aureliella helgolandensis]